MPSPPCVGTAIIGTAPARAGSSISPDGQTVYVAISSSGIVTPISVATNTAGPSLTGFTNPAAMAITPDGKTLYVTQSAILGTIIPINLATDTLGTVFSAGNQPDSLAITPDGKLAYAANFGASATTGSVTPITVATNTPGTNLYQVVVDPDGVAFAPASANVATLALNGAGSTNSIGAGGNLTYTLTATNSGPNVSTGTTLTDPLPANTSFVSATPSQGTCAFASGIVTCDLSGLPVGGNATVALVVSPTLAAAGGSLTDNASLFGNESPTNSVNPATATIFTPTVTNAADMSLSVAGGQSAATGHDATYALTATNNGPSNTTGVTVTDTLPSGFAFDAVTSSPSCTDPSGQTVTCSIGSLNSGAGATVTVAAIAPTAGQFTNQATVSSAQPDPTPGNNSLSISTLVAPAGNADLALAVTASPTGSIPVGSSLTYPAHRDRHRAGGGVERRGHRHAAERGALRRGHLEQQLQPDLAHDRDLQRRHPRRR